MEDVQRLFHVHGRLHGEGECVRSCGSLFIVMVKWNLAEQRPLAMVQRPLDILTQQKQQKQKQKHEEQQKHEWIGQQKHEQQQKDERQQKRPLARGSLAVSRERTGQEWR